MTDSLNARRARLIDALQPDDAILLVGAGEPVPLPEGTDQNYPYRSHSEYYYLAGMECPSGVLAVDFKGGACGEWVSFVPDLTERERIWDGRAPVPGTTIAALEPWLTQRRGRPIIMLGEPLRGVRADAALTFQAREKLRHLRRPKDAGEIALMRRAAAATAPGYARLRELIAPGVTERALQIEMEVEYLRHGASRTGYASIVGIGSNSAILHTEPTSHAAKAGDFVLVDAAAEVDRYMVDVTRTFVVGEPTPFQRDLHQIVVAAEERAVAKCRPGAEWKEIHLGAARDMVAGLVGMGVMRGAADSLVEQNAHLLFFPHGIGHMVGLGVRDASGSQPGRAKDPRPCLENLRMDLTLAPGYAVTVEPGLYFIPALLNDPKRREKHRNVVNWPLVDQHIGLGGVRIEDTVIVTNGEPESLTGMIPKTP